MGITDSLGRLRFAYLEVVELTLFSRQTETIHYDGPRTDGPIVIPFESGKWYRVAYRRDMNVNTGYQIQKVPYLFLEHPMLPGVSIGFRRDTFFT